MVKDLIIAPIFVEDEIQDANGVNRFQFKIPTPFVRLTLNRKGGIVDASVLEIVLFCLLHLDDKLFALRVFIINVEDGFSLATGPPELFR